MVEERGTTVLVVDDSPVLLSAVAEVLRQEGYDVVLAKRARQALELLLGGAPDVALIDIMLPDFSGIDLLERARAAGVETQLIVMTAHADVETATRAVEFRAFAYLEKPFDLDLLLSTVANAARLRRLDRDNRQMLLDLKAREEALSVAVAQAEARAAELDAVEAVANAASQSLDRREMLARALAAASRVLEADVEVLLADEAKAQLVLAARVGGLAPSEGEERIAYGAGIAGKVATSREAEVWDELPPEAFARLHLAPAYRAYTAAPLVAKGHFLGVVAAGRKRPFGERARAFFPRLAGVIAVALENALLFERAQAAVKTLEQSQERMLENERLAVVGQLASGLAHEINTPTAFILANLHVLAGHLATFERCLGEALAVPSLASSLQETGVERALTEAHHIVEESQEGGERIRRIVRGLRDFGHHAREGLQPVDLNELVDSTLDLLRPLLTARARLERRAEAVPQIQGHPGRLREALIQLLRNAADAIPPGAPELHFVTVSTRTEDGFALVEIRDSGVGIPAAVLPRVFDPYFTTKPVGQGTGLGLTMSLDVVRHHGGELKLESAAGVGTTAEVRLPLAASQPAYQAEPETPERQRVER